MFGLLSSLLLLAAINYAALRYPFAKTIVLFAMVVGGSGLVLRNVVNERILISIAYLSCCILLVSMQVISFKKFKKQV
jgi:fucose 4-O-acetylase-like acetyltransferase